MLIIIIIYFCFIIWMAYEVLKAPVINEENSDDEDYDNMNHTEGSFD